MADEEVMEEAALSEEEVTAKANAEAEAALKALDPAKRETHPAVMAIPGHSCPVKGCDFIFGDRQYGVEPHPIQHIVVKAWPTVGPPEPPPPPPPAPSDPGVCQNAIQVGNDCPVCGWKQNSAEPHPIRL